MSTLPTFSQIRDAPSGLKSPLADALEILFEHSPILVNVLEPQLNGFLQSSSNIASYSKLIDFALAEISKWNIQAQLQFIFGHPRIGENKNLSTLSANEQGAKGLNPTPPEVLARLAHLNACYEKKYPGLRYITFVNGRPRAAIAEEMEKVLDCSHSLSDEDPALESITPVDIGENKWKSELDRALYDIGRIAKSRLRAMGAD
ncbi:Oxo-4-hydroxy-4-carboxy-5-ureidoimidazoline decarboxylase [Gymnopilus junonius]|uniref:Oxo-4-hydroxy-4-carboxy-5-ureidoimidazoline decarboxylase n=1 Tax=Gymnopilus junonius TaxID=109634 RepID=A0A9P5TSP4_GYMJU|nr:Oxo-4-hydroxy-4-carboxy-5-ureidoimidazoline decarboxylase [Gymnopilus junonius]